MFRLFAFLPRRWWTARGWTTWKGYWHWRMETYGLYYPDGRWHGPAFTSLLKQFPSYYRWLGQMSRLRHR